MNGTLRRALCGLAVVGAMLLGAAGAAAAAPATVSRPTLPPATGTKAEHPVRPSTHQAACPQPGQRVQTPTSAAVYLIDPDFFANWIPNETVYFNLWDSWSGIASVTDATMISCFPEGYFTMSNAHLAKTSSSPKVYIYDINGGGYRWITSEAVFNKYAFSWGKIRVQAVSPVSSLNWDY